VGEGPQRDELIELSRGLNIADSVFLAGYKSNPYKYMARAALLVLASRSEGFALVIGEAMICGTPVIASDCDFGPREMLENGRYGLLVPVGDFNAMAQAILSILGDPSTARHYSQLGLQRARMFSVTDSVRCYRRVLSSIVRGDE
jgi:glycosyltransferase involved in cell wall biosynthesis